MADTKISALTDGTGITPGDLVPSARSGANYKVDPRIYTPVRAGVGHTNYWIGPRVAAVSPDEALELGYNVFGTSSSEPGTYLAMEIDYVATARGVANKRTMETYIQFGADPASAPSNTERAWFYSFEPGDTSQGGSTKGQILYGYLSTGYNRIGTPGGGGLTITPSGNNNTDAIAFFDTEGCRFDYLTTRVDIEAFTLVSANPLTFDVGAGHGIFPGTWIQIYKNDTSGGVGTVWVENWHSGARVGAQVTATTSTRITTSLNATGFGIATGYGWKFAKAYAQKSAAAFQAATVGTAAYDARHYTFEVCGQIGLTGKAYFLDNALAGNSVGDGKTFGGLLNFGSSRPDQGGIRQQLTFYNSLGSFAVGYPDETVDDADNYMFAFGQAQSTDANFTIANSILSITYFQDNTIGVGGISSIGKARVTIAAGTARVAQIYLAQQSTPPSTTYANGQIWLEDATSLTGLKIRINGATHTINMT